jgi:oxygen-dependent protoporphyrinogen oxidase
MSHVRVGVVGAGITGLTLVHHLREQTVDVVALEATDDVGGVIRSETVDGRLLERGPQRTRLTDDVAALVDDVGLHDAVLAGDPELPIYVYADGELGSVPFSVGTFLTTDLLSWRGKLRLLAEPLTAAGSEAEMAAELFSRKFGREAYENVVGPLFGGIYGSDPAEMPAGYAPSALLTLEARAGSLLKPALKRALENERPPPLSFDGGLQRLPRAIYEANAGAVDLARPVEAIEEASDGFRLVTPDGMEIVDRVVVTTPADVSADLLDDLAPDAAGRLRDLNYNRLAMASLQADVDRGGFGYQVAHDEELRTRGVSWNGPLFGPDGAGAPDREGVFTAFLGGMTDPEILDEDDETIGRVAVEEFEQVMGVEPAVLDVTRLERGFPAWDTSWRALDGFEVPGGIQFATNYTDRMGIPGRLRQAERLAEQFVETEYRDTTAAGRA